MTNATKGGARAIADLVRRQLCATVEISASRGGIQSPAFERDHAMVGQARGIRYARMGGRCAHGWLRQTGFASSYLCNAFAIRWETSFERLAEILETESSTNRE